MHKTELVKRLSLKHHRTQAYYKGPLEEILAEIQEVVAEGKPLTFLGFGTFYTRMRKPSTIRDIKTKQMKDVPAVRVVQFSAGDVLKRIVRKRTPQGSKPKKAKSLLSRLVRH